LRLRARVRRGAAGRVHGRLALLERGDDEFGPYQSPMEDGMQHFHEWYRREMGATKTTQSI
jgi:choline monooxygenase